MEYAIDIKPSESTEAVRRCGADPEYDAAFIALQQAAIGTREQQFGDTVIPAVAPDWRQVERQASSLLERTTDLRVIALLTLAWTETEGLAGYANGLTLAADTLERYWDHVHPRIDATGESDPLPRINAIAALTDPQALGRSARNAMLLRRQSGALALRDAAAILENSKPSHGAISATALSPADLRSLLKAARTELTVVARLLDVIERIGRQIAAKLDASWVPDAGAVTTPLRIVHQAIRESDAPFTGTSAERAEPSFTAHEPVARSVPGSRASAGPPPWMPIRSRADALLALDNVCTYLEHAEPGHPAPLLIRRVQRLMHMNFYDIVRDMAPTALPQLDILAGPTERP